MPRRKLQPHLTPQHLRGRTISEVLRKHGLRCYWEGVIRREVARKAKGRCQICGVRRDSARDRASSLDAPLPWAACHEVWSYDFDTRTATITALQHVCRRCNQSLHIGIAASRFLGEGNIASWDEVVNHIARVNRISLQQAQGLVDKALGGQPRLDSVRWKPKISEPLLERFPALRLIRL